MKSNTINKNADNRFVHRLIRYILLFVGCLFISALLSPINSEAKLSHKPTFVKAASKLWKTPLNNSHTIIIDAGKMIDLNKHVNISKKIKIGISNKTYWKSLAADNYYEGDWYIGRKVYKYPDGNGWNLCIYEPGCHVLEIIDNKTNKTLYGLRIIALGKNMKYKNNWIFKVNKNEAKAVACCVFGKKRSISVPSKVGKATVTAVSKEVETVSPNHSVTKIKLGKSVKKIGAWSFYCWKNLKKVTGSVERVGERAFDHTPIKDVLFLDNVKKIDEGAFNHCDNLREIVINGANAVLDSCFVFEGNLKKVVLNGIKMIKKQCFYENYKLESVQISSGHIGEAVFAECSSLKEIDLDGVETIGRNAFAESGLEYVYIPPSVKEIKLAAFRDCSNLKEVYLLSKPIMERFTKGNYDPVSHCQLYVVTDDNLPIFLGDDSATIYWGSEWENETDSNYWFEAYYRGAESDSHVKELRKKNIVNGKEETILSHGNYDVTFIGNDNISHGVAVVGGLNGTQIDYRTDNSRFDTAKKNSSLYFEKGETISIDVVNGFIKLTNEFVYKERLHPLFYKVKLKKGEKLSLDYCGMEDSTYIYLFPSNKSEWRESFYSVIAGFEIDGSDHPTEYESYEKLKYWYITAKSKTVGATNIVTVKKGYVTICIPYEMLDFIDYSVA